MCFKLRLNMRTDMTKVHSLSSLASCLRGKGEAEDDFEQNRRKRYNAAPRRDSDMSSSQT